ncbi:CLEC18 [Mytilus coruscus]|uniref:CLEC18 n=1 Tax=Mytilus coruscus TaxID=42192 RepID=A0A6J8E0D2_MYTCO|nr:CLEC18 [Mytilus coruscus]
MVDMVLNLSGKGNKMNKTHNIWQQRFIDTCIYNNEAFYLQPFDILEQRGINMKLGFFVILFVFHVNVQVINGWYSSLGGVCGYRRYNPRLQSCCGGVVTSKGSCCGTRSYNHRLNSCCGGMVTSKGSCCGTRSYNHRLNSCCGGMVTSKGSCCGTRSYNHRLNSCCGGVVTSKVSCSYSISGYRITWKTEPYQAVAIHNRYRRILANGAYNFYVANMNKLHLNESLQHKAEEMLNCELLNTEKDLVPEKMNIGFSKDGSIASIIHKWFLEIQHFIPNFMTCLDFDSCRRFMTMTNSQYTQIGCAFTQQCMVNNEKASVLVCFYDGGQSLVPPNLKRGSPCTKCSGREGFCDNGLCDCRKTCNKSGVGSGILNISTCTCSCQFGMGPNCDEPCKNPEQYYDYDICGPVTESECLSDDEEERALLQEFCPEQCTCKKFANATVQGASGSYDVDYLDS